MRFILSVLMLMLRILTTSVHTCVLRRVYKDHFKDWAAFEASGGVKDITVVFGGGVEGSEALMTPK